MGYKTVIQTRFQGDTADTMLMLDVVDNKSIEDSSTILSQPMENGDTFSEHMYRNPTTISLSGTFALNGKYWDDNSYNFQNAGDRLTNIEEVFTTIKDQGLLCTIITIQENEDGSVGNASRFMIRKSMALERISWKEKQNSLDFSFSFKQIILVSPTQIGDQDIGMVGGDNNPAVTSPGTGSLGQVLLETGQLPQVVIKSLYDAGFIENDFLKSAVGFFQAMGVYTLTAALVMVGVAAGIIVGAIAFGLSTAGAIAGVTVAGAITAAMVPVGTLIAAGAAVIAGLAAGIAYLCNYEHEQARMKLAFKLINGKPDKDCDRLRILLEDISVVVNKVNAGVTVYSITTNEPQKLVLNIGGYYYTLEFYRNNSVSTYDATNQGKDNGSGTNNTSKEDFEEELNNSGKSDYPWACRVTDMKDQPVSTYNSFPVVSNMLDCDRYTNMWFRSENYAYEVYLLNPSLDLDENADQASINSIKADLTTYSIWVSNGRIADNVKKVTDAISDAIKQEGFV